MYLKRRLKRLEVLEWAKGREDEEEHIISEAISRATDEDLKLIVECLKRIEDEQGEPTPEEWAAIERYFQLQEEVRDELGASA